MTITEAPERAVLGQRLPRKEDPALLTGESEYTNDLLVPGALHLAVLRSPYTCATINSVDALSGLGEDDVPMPASPLNVWNAINNARRQAGGAAQGGSQ